MAMYFYEANKNQFNNNNIFTRLCNDGNLYFMKPIKTNLNKHSTMLQRWPEPKLNCMKL